MANKDGMVGSMHRLTFFPVLGLVALVLLSGCSVFGVRSGYEAPDYSVSERVGDDIEIRDYQRRLAAQTGGDRSEAFRRLFRYITGENRAPGTDETAEIAMTTPVEVAGAQKIAMTTPVETGGSEGPQMRFFLPRDYAEETAPIPTDPQVSLITVPARTLAVLRFSGLGSQSTVNARKEQLMETLDGSAWQPQTEPIAFFYDPPWTLPFLRRNEVAVEVKRR